MLTDAEKQDEREARTVASESEAIRRQQIQEQREEDDR